MDKGPRVPLESQAEFERWFWDQGPMERPGDGQPPQCSALQASAAADSSPGHSIDRGESVGYAHVFDKAPPPTLTYVSWYRHRAEELGDLAAEMIAEGLEDHAFAHAFRAAHYGGIANALYAKRAEELRAQHPEWWKPRGE